MLCNIYSVWFLGQLGMVEGQREGLITVRRYMVVHGSERPKEMGGGAKLTNKKLSERVYSSGSTREWK